MMMAVVMAIPAEAQFAVKSQQSEEAQKNLSDAFMILQVATSEMQLVAPKSVFELANNIKDEYMNLWFHVNDAQERERASKSIAERIYKLYEAMRDDLGTNLKFDPSQAL